MKRRWFSAQYWHHRFIIEEMDNANSIHAFNRFEEEGYLERFQCHFRLVDLPRDTLYALVTPPFPTDHNCPHFFVVHNKRTSFLM